jgi:lysophospholipase L1-like esterase
MAVYAITDQNGALAWWVTQSGAVEFGKLGPKAQALIATLVGGPAKNYQSSYTPTKLPAGVSDTRPVSSGPDFVGVGHSMMAGAGGSGTTIMSVLATLSGRTCRTMAVGGETSEPIIGRQGGNPFLLLPTDGTIHADTSASTVTYDFDGGHDSDQVWVLLQGTGDPGQGSIATGLHGTLAGVPGYLRIVQPSNPGSTHNATDYYTFTRDTAGAAVTVNRPTPFYCDAGLARRNDIPVFWIGRNNISNIARIQADLAAAIEWLAPADKRFLILSEHNNTSEVSGSTNWTNVTTLNRNLRNLYGRRFIDSRKYLIQYGLADAGLTATTQDNTDIANDCVPTQLTADGLHLTGAGYTILANLVNQRATELGWI